MKPVAVFYENGMMEEAVLCGCMQIPYDGSISKRPMGPGSPGYLCRAIWRKSEGTVGQAYRDHKIWMHQYTLWDFEGRNT